MSTQRDALFTQAHGCQLPFLHDILRAPPPPPNLRFLLPPPPSHTRRVPSRRTVLRGAVSSQARPRSCKKGGADPQTEEASGDGGRRAGPWRRHVGRPMAERIFPFDRKGAPATGHRPHRRLCPHARRRRPPHPPRWEGAAVGQVGGGRTRTGVCARVDGLALAHHYLLRARIFLRLRLRRRMRFLRHLARILPMDSGHATPRMHERQ